MYGSYIKFSSITHAQMARDLLSRHGIRSSVGRNTNPNRKQGCNFALFVDSNALENAFAIVQNNRIKNMGYERGSLI